MSVDVGLDLPAAVVLVRFLHLLLSPLFTLCSSEGHHYAQPTAEEWRAVVPLLESGVYTYTTWNSAAQEICLLSPVATRLIPQIQSRSLVVPFSQHPVYLCDLFSNTPNHIITGVCRKGLFSSQNFSLSPGVCLS